MKIDLIEGRITSEVNLHPELEFQSNVQLFFFGSVLIRRKFCSPIFASIQRIERTMVIVATSSFTDVCAAFD